jgi:long-chain acyl-CoA synthetase
MSLHHRDSLTLIPHHLFNQAQLRPHSPSYYVHHQEQWVPTSWEKYTQQVTAVGCALLKIGVQAEDRICILGFNRPEWTITALAAQCIGAIPTGIYTTCSVQEIYYILSHSDAKVVIVEYIQHWFILHQIRPYLPNLKKIVLMEGAWDLSPDHPSFCNQEAPLPPLFFTHPPFKDIFEPLEQKPWAWSELCLHASSDPDTFSWSTFITHAVDEEFTSLFNQNLSNLKGDQTASLIYTSGTTGPPKAVMLTHNNLAWIVYAGQHNFGFTHQDCVISYLPLSHIAEQLFSLYGPVSVGFSVYFARSIDLLLEDLKSVRPTLFFAVPRVWEKMYQGLSNRLTHLTGFKKRVIPQLQKIALKSNVLKNQNKSIPFSIRLRYALAQHLFGRVKAALGLDRTRVCLTGAAPIRDDILSFFASLDLRIFEVYGQSEGCGLTSFNHPNYTQFGTVGRPLSGSDVFLADDGEICVKGPHIFKGYFKDLPATQAVLTQEGVLKSGDLGVFNQAGYLKIIGRKKEIIITSGGKNIAPKPIENAVCSNPLISQAVVIGDQRKYLSVLITLNPDRLKEWISTHTTEGTDPISIEDAPTHPNLLQAISNQVNAVNLHLAQVEKIKKFTVLPQEFSIENGELTPTLKLKKALILKRYHQEIDLMYLS